MIDLAIIALLILDLFFTMRVRAHARRIPSLQHQLDALGRATRYRYNVTMTGKGFGHGQSSATGVSPQPQPVRRDPGRASRGWGPWERPGRARSDRPTIL